MSRTKTKPEDRQGAVYKIKCRDCQASYIGETDRNLSTRLTEHKRATRNGDVNNYITEHHLPFKTTEMMMNNVVLMFSPTDEKTPNEQGDNSNFIWFIR